MDLFVLIIIMGYYEDNYWGNNYHRDNCHGVKYHRGKYYGDNRVLG